MNFYSESMLKTVLNVLYMLVSTLENKNVLCNRAKTEVVQTASCKCLHSGCCN